MKVSQVEAIAKLANSILVAPAGYGKTHTIANAVAHHSEGKQLILTHTHAGVGVIRDRLKEMASSQKYHIETIAGWMKKYTCSFPVLSDLKHPEPTTDQEWADIYRSFLKLLNKKAIQDIIRVSYSGAFIDEYQDCTDIQHQAITKLSSIIPCRILGDPLQAIFNFRSEVPVNWIEDFKEFEPIPTLTIPWRWYENSRALGDWVDEVRDLIDSNQAIDLSNAPSEHVSVILMKKPIPKIDPKGYAIYLNRVLKTCRETAKQSGKVIAIHDVPAVSAFFCKKLGGLYSMIESVEAPDLADNIEPILTNQGIERVKAVIEFASLCVTQINTMKPVIEGLEKNKVPKRKGLAEQTYCCIRVKEHNSPNEVIQLLRVLLNVPDAILYRRELYFDMIKALQEFSSGRYENPREAAHAVRNITRQAGRRTWRCCMGSTHLVKGLEFDHSIILEAQSFKEKNNLYVALTRGVKSITIITDSMVLSPYNQ
ncbi:MAG TPA: UvrD-helicase domain-containing protein [Coleofasciculaceae cyanobacterium]|jgi:DNA helicase-2/ATP-dependent DNA helicase PcrA